MLTVQSNSRQIPKSREICANKKYNDVLYAYLQCISEREDDDKRLVSKKLINFSKLGTELHLTRQTVSTKFKNLLELDLVAVYDENYYILKPLPKDIATLIPYPTLRVLVDALNENAISAYAYLLNRYYSNNCQSFQFTLDQVKTFIGISTSTRSNNDVVTNILFVLEKVGLIKYSLTTLQQESFQNVKTIYSLDSLTNTLVVT